MFISGHKAFIAYEKVWISGLTINIEINNFGNKLTR